MSRRAGEREAEGSGGPSAKVRNQPKSERLKGSAEDASEKVTTAPSIRRVIVRTSTQKLTTRDSTVAWFVAGGPKGVEEEKEVWKHGKKRKEEGTGRWFATP